MTSAANLRTLKKLSKRAAPLLPLLGDRRDQFPAARGEENCTHAFVAARKHWERDPCHPGFMGRNAWSSPRGADRVMRTRAGRTIVLRPPSEPRKGTVMVGATSGYYEPEWDELTAWEALCHIVFVAFTDWSKQVPTLTRRLRTPTDIFRAAAELISKPERATA